MLLASDPRTTVTVNGLSSSAYIRERAQPRLRDLNYLHLSDLAKLLGQIAPTIHGEVLDYGCGGAPYRHLFTHCKRYVAADIQSAASVDLVLQPDGTTGEPDSSYDAVLSTQVLEHIKRPDAYLQECHRILRPSGQLILTTHGMFEEHGCPYDYNRWTSRGLEDLILKSGFQVLESSKLTTEQRAFVQLANQAILHLRCPEKPWVHYALAVVRKAYCVIGVPALNWFADLFSYQAIVPANSPASLYVCIYVRATRI